jgi:hypothetical protein
LEESLIKKVTRAVPVAVRVAGGHRENGAHDPNRSVSNC